MRPLTGRIAHVAISIFALSASFATAAERETALTVYSSADPASFDPQQFIAQQGQGYNPGFAWQVPGFGVVREKASFAVEQGQSELRMTDVAEFIDPTTVSIIPEPKSGVTVLEQRFEFDLVSPQKLYEKFLGQSISLVTQRGDGVATLNGTLLSAHGNQLVLDTPEGVRVVNGFSETQLGRLPRGLMTRPTLVLQVNSEGRGTRVLETAYQTNGLTWRSDYSLILAENEQNASLSAWVTLMNLSGKSYEDTRLKLVAGDVRRVQQRPNYRLQGFEATRVAAAPVADAFEEKAFFEYHLYTLPRRTNVSQNSTQQIALFPAVPKVKVEKALYYRGFEMARYHPGLMLDQHIGKEGSNKKVDVYIRLENKKENGLGMPLPAGKVRAYKRDNADGAVEFIGEDVIDHTPRNESVLLKVGQSFDVVGERKQADYSVDTSRRMLRETIRVELRNNKEISQKVIVREPMYRALNWRILQESHQHEKVDAHTIEYPVEVAPEGKSVIEYQVEYTW